MSSVPKESMVQAVESAALRPRLKADILQFSTTADLEPLDDVLGQTRAVEALAFGIGIDQPGFNLFAFGPSEAGIHDVVMRLLERDAKKAPTPDDWVYVFNFKAHRYPRALRLPPGRGAVLRADMDKLIEDLRVAVPAAFETDEYRARAKVIQEEIKVRHQKALAEIERHAGEQSISLVQTPLGMGFAPIHDGEVLSPPDFAKLPEKERAEWTEKIERLQEELQEVVAQFPAWQREGLDRMRELQRSVTSYAVEHLIRDLKAKHRDVPAIPSHLDAVQADIIENAAMFLHQETPGQGDGKAQAGDGVTGASGVLESFRRYRINLLVERGADGGRPIVYEPNPSYQNLVGRVEQMSHLGTLVTDFNLIQPGALHRANGGFLILDVRKVLTLPFAWEGLKGALRAKEIRIESLGEAYSFVSTVSLEPEHIPLDVKVVLIGNPMLYYLLSHHDEDVGDLFKVAVDFDDRMALTDESTLLYARMIAALVRDGKHRPLDRDAVALTMERSIRLAGDVERLSTLTGTLGDLLSEADFHAGVAGADVIGRAHVQTAIHAARRRLDRMRERLQEQTENGTILIATEGAAVGQINGLSVLQIGGYAFGRPSRITARVRIGRGQVVDIEREVELGGSLHSKGVLILSNFLAARFSANEPLSLAASLVFEQSYGGVDGDSASSAELYALLSALSDVPIRQGFAVTGSVNQMGDVQAIGGVNEKIEGFFDLCVSRGLDGSHGVLIPASNLRNLVLREDVVEAVREGRFAVYPIARIDQGIALLTGVDAGVPDAEGIYPEGTINRRVADRLAEFVRKRRSFGAASQSEDAKE